MGKPSIYDDVTAKIIAELESGRIPWVQPWDSTSITVDLGLPTNAKSGNAYSGVNVLVLWANAMHKGFASRHWCTYKQAQALGGNVRKDERATTVCYADRFTPKGEAERARAAGETAKQIAFLKRYSVFNILQCEGLPESLYESRVELPEREQLPVAESLIDATGADFRIGGAKAFYVPSSDHIQVPPQQAFGAQIDYYRTCFHEIGHWSGHESRLARDFGGSFGSKLYTAEELVAEMTAAFVCATLQIKPTVRHADYIGSWLEVLKNDNKAIFRAASKASKAADFILAFQTETSAAVAA